MKRPIKFRGIFPGGGLVAYGDLLHTKHGVFIVNEHGGQMEVNPKSIAQLVGYDRDGNEVYEGDELTDENRFTYVAQLWNVARNPHNYVFPPDWDRLTLEEDTK